MNKYHIQASLLRGRERERESLCVCLPGESDSMGSGSDSQLQVLMGPKLMNVISETEKRGKGRGRVSADDRR